MRSGIGSPSTMERCGRLIRIQRDFASPFVGELREDVDAGDVFAELGVVRRGRQHFVGPVACAVQVGVVELLDEHARGPTGSRRPR